MDSSFLNLCGRHAWIVLLIAMASIGVGIASPDAVVGVTDTPPQPLDSSSSSSAVVSFIDVAAGVEMAGSGKNLSMEGVGPKSEEAPELVEGAVERTSRHRYLHRGRRSLSGGEGRRRRRGRGRAGRGVVGGGGEGGGGSAGESGRRGGSHSSPEDVEDEETSPSTRGPKRNCTSRSCRIREEAKRIRLEVIKAQILQKLRLTHVPNITKMDVPRLPTPIEHLIDEYGTDGRLAAARAADYGSRTTSSSTSDDEGVDDDVEDDEDDDFHATTTKVIKFGEKRKEYPIDDNNNNVYIALSLSL